MSSCTEGKSAKLGVENKVVMSVFVEPLYCKGQ